MHYQRKGKGGLGKKSTQGSRFVARVYRDGAIKRPTNQEFTGRRREPDTNAPNLTDRWIWSGVMDRPFRDSELGR